MSTKPNPVHVHVHVHARVGRERRFSVSPPVRKEFVAITGERAKLAAWAHAARIVERDATFDSRGYSVI
ncbi:hypothetical protein WHZ77_06110 [Bradyrhizobium sp. A5]|uniref:hypothetical protein n=1 Tax=Bradyrhizobium sp. A5 TaxID=3133696 RepID=UPI0032540BE2